MFFDTLNGMKLHCNGIDPFITLMGSFNWGPISRKDIVSDKRSTQPLG